MSNEQNLENLYEAITKAIIVAEAKANNALKSGEITESEWQKAKVKWGKLETIKSEIKAIMINEELKKSLLNNNPDSPRSKIEQATNSLNKSAEKIDDFNSFLSEIDKALKIIGSTIKLI